MLKSKLAAVFVVLCLGSLIGLSSGLANTESNSQNADLTAFASLSPNAVTDGEVLSVQAAVTNNTAFSNGVQVKATLMFPDGRIIQEANTTIWVSAHSTNVVSLQNYTINPCLWPRGKYKLVFKATSATGSSRAVATTTVQ